MSELEKEILLVSFTIIPMIILVLCLFDDKKGVIKKLKFSLCLPGILLFFYYLIQKNAFVCGFTFLFVCLNFVLKECSRKVAGIIIGLILSLIFILMFYTEVLL